MANVISITDIYPVDSVIKTDETGKPVLDEYGFVIPDRVANASVLQDVMETFFSSGVFANYGDELTVSSLNGTWSVGTGKAMIKGTRVRVNQAEEVIDQSEIETGNYAYIVIASRRDTPYRDGAIYSVVNTSPLYTPVRDESTYELVLARIDWRGNMVDYRFDTSMCGIAAPFESIDTDEFMETIRVAIDQFNLNVGEVESLPSGSTPTVTIRKPTMAGGDVYMDLGIPRGAPGEPGRDAPGLYIQEDKPSDPAEGTIWFGIDRDNRQLDNLEVYEVTGTYPGEVYPGEAYPGGNAAWADYKINPALIAGNQS